jgi:hypothetical protein
MRLALYSSTLRSDKPNLVALQHPALLQLPTVLVCPLIEQLAMTPAREKIILDGVLYVVACDLLRPINRQTLRPMGELPPPDSERILKTFLQLLADLKNAD